MSGVFQSPFRRGNKCNCGVGRLRANILMTFSPLFVGETNVTNPPPTASTSGANILMTFSPLFVGETNVTIGEAKEARAFVDFQSPFRRGNKCNKVLTRVT